MLCRYIWLLFWNAMVLLTVTFHLERLSQFHIWKLDLITSRTVWAQEESFGKSNIHATLWPTIRCLFSVNWWGIWEHVSLLILGNEIHHCGRTVFKASACPDTQELNRISLYHTYCTTLSGNPHSKCWRHKNIWTIAYIVYSVCHLLLKK